MTGLEPGTFRLQGECSNQLSYIGCMFESLKLVFVFKTCPLLLNFLVMEVECKYFPKSKFHQNYWTSKIYGLCEKDQQAIQKRKK